MLSAIFDFINKNLPPKDIVPGVSALISLCAFVLSMASLWLARRQWSESNRPFLGIYATPSDNTPPYTYDLIVRNHGTRLARDIRVRLSPESLRDALAAPIADFNGGVSKEPRPQESLQALYETLLMVIWKANWANRCETAYQLARSLAAFFRGLIALVIKRTNRVFKDVVGWRYIEFLKLNDDLMRLDKAVIPILGPAEENKTAFGSFGFTDNPKTNWQRLDVPIRAMLTYRDADGRNFKSVFIITLNCKKGFAGSYWEHTTESISFDLFALAQEPHVQQATAKRRKGS